MNRICQILLLIVSCQTMMLAQSPVDSLELRLKDAKGGYRIKVLNKLFEHYITHDPVKATAYTKEALSLAIEKKDSAGIAASFNNLGLAYKNHGALDNALEYYLRAESIFKEIGDQKGRTAAHNNIGTIYSAKKDYEKGMEYFSEALKGFNENKDSVRMAGVLNNMGIIMSEQNNTEKALEYFNQAVSLDKGLDEAGIDPLISIGTLYLKQNDHEKAIEYLRKASEEAAAVQDQMSLLVIQAGLGDAWLRAGDLRTSEKLLTDALRICQTTESYFYEPAILRNLALNYSKQGRMKDAFEYMIRYDQARERVNGEESSRRIAQMEMALDIHAKEGEIEALKKDEALKDLQLQRTQLAITLLVLGILTTVLLVNFWIQRKKSRRA